MEVILAMWIVYRFFKMLTDAMGMLPDRYDRDGNAIFRTDEGIEVYGDGVPATEERRERKDPLAKRTVKRKDKKNKKPIGFKITEPDEDEAFSLDGGSLDDDDELVYPE